MYYIDDLGVGEKQMDIRIRNRWQMDVLRETMKVDRALDRAKARLEQFLMYDIPKDHSSNLFLIWPIGLWDWESFLHFRGDLLRYADLGDGLQRFSLQKHTVNGSRSEMVALPFHECASSPDDPTPDPRFLSPFPMLHIIPYRILQEKRLHLDRMMMKGHPHVRDKNDKLMQQASSQEIDYWYSFQIPEAEDSASTFRRRSNYEHLTQDIGIKPIKA